MVYAMIVQESRDGHDEQAGTEQQRRGGVG